MKQRMKKWGHMKERQNVDGGNELTKVVNQLLTLYRKELWVWQNASDGQRWDSIQGRQLSQITSDWYRNNFEDKKHSRNVGIQVLKNIFKQNKANDRWQTFTWIFLVTHNGVVGLPWTLKLRIFRNVIRSVVTYVWEKWT